MEVVAIAVILFSGLISLSSADEEETQAVAIVANEETSVVPESANDYVQVDGYFIKDLSVRHESPEGCNKPVLTADLSQPIHNGVRTVTEIAASCEG